MFYAKTNPKETQKKNLVIFLQNLALFSEFKLNSEVLSLRGNVVEQCRHK